MMDKSYDELVEEWQLYCSKYGSTLNVPLFKNGVIMECSIMKNGFALE
ncbi:MAG: hypothetical protein AAF740_08950 [Bacteroidota bacterium]